ncbi:hypothetical protein C8P66_11533 [Humitalea rosea]|uniref:Uncharacterized protein n=1 Tax=Humitalea rosea TaxID=990373 RepID=A0A2W7ID93_9PROT|nr:hypothetical protein [Humitalea rosea]PZW43572.1 hypothetical protein C8P66_11533 [Humitalea rosea]
MSDSTLPPFRATPQLGDHVWQGANLAPDAFMRALGSKATAEIEAALAGAGGLTELIPELNEIAGRLDHGRGLALLRGLPVERLAPDAAAKAALLALLCGPLGSQIAPPGPMAEEPGRADVWALLSEAAQEVMLVSAAAVHNAVMQADRGALARFFAPPRPVFSTTGGVFAGRHRAHPALAEALSDPALALRLHLRAGDVLLLNPSLVWWVGPPPKAVTGLALTTEPSRLGLPIWA